MIHADALPVAWITDQALAQFKAVLDARVAQWCSDWGVSATLTSHAHALSCHYDTKLLAPAGRAADGIADCMHPPLLALKAEEAAQLIFGASQVSTEVSSAIAAEAASAFAQAFAQALAVADGLEAAPSQALGRQQALPGHIGALYTLTTPLQQLQVWASTQTMFQRGWLARPKPDALARWQPSTVMANLPVQLSVDIGEADVSIGDLNALGDGDVLLVTSTLAAPLAVRTSDGKLQLQAHIGAVGPSRAVQFVSNAKKK